MVIAAFSDKFKELFAKIKDSLTKDRLVKQIEKLKLNPELGKPMRFNRKGTREVYIKPFTLSYAHLPQENTIYFLDIYHKDEQ